MMSLDEFAREANRATGTDLFSAAAEGKVSNLVKGAGRKYGDFIDDHMGPVQNFMGEVGANLFELFEQDPDVGRQYGEGLSLIHI